MNAWTAGLLMKSSGMTLRQFRDSGGLERAMENCSVWRLNSLTSWSLLTGACPVSTT
jgi:hypothetical protein